MFSCIGRAVSRVSSAASGLWTWLRIKRFRIEGVPILLVLGCPAGLLHPQSYDDLTANELYLRGNILLERKDYSHAIEYFNRALKKEPKSVPARLHRGLAWSLLGNNEKARKDYVRSLELDPHLGQAHNELAQLPQFESTSKFFWPFGVPSQ
jgi:tetratricopeptide (TPR) repeat protein